MTWVALVDSYPLEAQARRSLGWDDGMADGTPYLGVWRMRPPFDSRVHVFSDDLTAEQLVAAEWTREDA